MEGRWEGAMGKGSKLTTEGSQEGAGARTRRTEGWSEGSRDRKLTMESRPVWEGSKLTAEGRREEHGERSTRGGAGTSS